MDVIYQANRPHGVVVSMPGYKPSGPGLHSWLINNCWPIHEPRAGLKEDGSRLKVRINRPPCPSPQHTPECSLVLYAWVVLQINAVWCLLGCRRRRRVPSGGSTAPRPHPAPPRTIGMRLFRSRRHSEPPPNPQASTPSPTLRRGTAGVCAEYQTVKAVPALVLEDANPREVKKRPRPGHPRRGDGMTWFAIGPFFLLG
uniref:Uncharacterized protein n=1 Tax=Timema douglasi TaxID=61478 RepID=A0A7R8VFA0_TIMDO|nr:unnamed protein product [Timema douglasi]